MKYYFTKNGRLKIPKSTRWDMRKRVAVMHQRSHTVTEQRNLESSQTEFDTSAPKESSEDQIFLPFHNFESVPHFRTDIEINQDTAEIINEQGAPPIFSGARVSKSQLVLLVMAYAVRHKLSNLGLQDLLTLVNFVLPVGTSFPSSVHLLNKELDIDFAAQNRHYYCLSCEELLTPQSKSCQRCSPKCCKFCNVSVVEEDQKCPSCSSDVVTKTVSPFFVSFDIRKSLQQLLGIPSVGKCLVRTLYRRHAEARDSIYREIWDGKAYKALKITGSTLSCFMNTDGASFFESSQFTVWPILLSLNEIDYKFKRKFTVLVGLWWGESKPNFDLFLQPLVDQVNVLICNGIDWSYGGVSYNSPVLFPMMAADSVARCVLQGITQFNGAHSCPWCLDKGESLNDAEGKHKKWIFPSKVDAAVRTKESFIADLIELQNKLSSGFKDEQSKLVRSVHGIHSAFKLLLIPHFDIVNGMLFDYLHTVLIGVLKTFTTAWFNTSNHDQPFYIGRKKDLVNSRIQRTKFPSTRARVLRPLKAINFWKASEWRQWLLFCTTILDGILAPQFLSHISKFCTAIIILLQDEISDSEITKAETLLKTFCNCVVDLYGKDFCLFNVHILKHASECVRNWGPLSCYSLFQFENYNNVLLNSFSGTTKVGEQIVRRVLTTRKLYSMENLGDEAVNLFYLSLIQNQKYYEKLQKEGDCTFMGSSKTYAFSAIELQILGGIGVTKSFGKSYNVCVVKDKLFKTTIRNTKRSCSSIVRSAGKYYEIHKLIWVQGSGFGIVFVKHLFTLQECNITGTFRLRVIQRSKTIKVLRTFEIDKCTVCSYYNTQNELTYILQLPNSYEVE